MSTTFDYAEELTLTDIRSLVLRRLRVTDTTRYSPTAGAADYDWIDDAINEGLKKFVKTTKCLRSYAIYIPIASHQVYRCPESFIDLKSAYYYNSSLPDGYKELHIKSLGWLNDHVSDWRTATGTPNYIYIDRMFGRRWFFGLVPIPDTAGSPVTWDTTYGSELTEVCSLTTYNEEFVELPQSGLYFCPDSQTSPGKPVETMQDDILLEHYRLPRVINTTAQYPEIPREYQSALADYAAGELLQHNPEDSVEFKRAATYLKKLDDAIKDFEKQRKSVALIGKELNAGVGVQTWLSGMNWYKGLP